MRFFDAETRARLVDRYRRWPVAATGVATVRDYCDSADWLAPICGTDGDLKNVQRPWMVKAILSRLPPGRRLLEIGAGEPLVASALADLGYDVTVIDPYDGSGNGPTAYEAYRTAYPEVRLVRASFGDERTPLEGCTFDAVYSVSVLEHLRHDALPRLFRSVATHLAPGGHSVHCIDHVLDGGGAGYHVEGLRVTLAWQQALAVGRDAGEADASAAAALVEHLQATARHDVETFFLSPQGHHLWRAGLPYDEFPFRKVISVHTAVTVPPAPTA